MLLLFTVVVRICLQNFWNVATLNSLIQPYRDRNLHPVEIIYWWLTKQYLIDNLLAYS